MSHTASYRSRFLLLPLLLLLFTELAWSQRVSIQTRLDRSEIRIGEQAAVEMTIRTDDLARTRFHLVEDSTGVERFRVLAFGATDTVDLGGGLKEIQAKMIVTSFDSTLITLPPILVETPSGRALSKPLALNVISPQVDMSHPERFEPIIAPWEVRLTLADILEMLARFLFIFPVGLILLALGILYRRWRRRRADQPIPSQPLREKTLLEIFTEHLAELESYPLHSQGDFKVYYTKLIEELRLFFGSLYGIETSEKTSEELLHALAEQGVDRPSLDKTAGILQLADVVKFAKSLPSQEEAESHRQTALELARHEYERKQAQLPQSTEIGKEVVA